jgi:predicted MFS family arabinose efflux permease
MDKSLIVAGDAQKARGLSMMMLGMGGLTGGFLSGWLTNAIGLRKSMLLCFSVCAIMSFVLFKTNTSFSPVIYAEIIILALFFGASQGVLSVYVPNLFRLLFAVPQLVFVLTSADYLPQRLFYL